jgi:hypothetical protein
MNAQRTRCSTKARIKKSKRDLEIKHQNRSSSISLKDFSPNIWNGRGKRCVRESGRCFSGWEWSFVCALLWGRVWEVYIKVLPKAGGRRENLTEIRLNRFQIRLNRIPPVGFRFTGGLSRRLDRTQIRLNRFQIRFNRFQIRLNRIQNSVQPVSNSVEPDSKFGWTGFQKIYTWLFLTGLTGRLAEGNSAETGWTGFRSGWTGFWTVAQILRKSKWNKGKMEVLDQGFWALVPTPTFFMDLPW